MTKEHMDLVREGTNSAERKNIVHKLFYNAWFDAGKRGTLEGATGIGKTKAAIVAIVMQFAKKADSIVVIAVPTETLRDVDWPAEFVKWGHPELVEKTTRVCWVSLSELKVPTEVDLFVGDEVHHLTSAASKFFDTNRVWNMLGLTATLPAGAITTTAGVRRTLIDQYMPSVFKVSLEEGIELSLVADFKIKVIFHELDTKEMYIPNGTKARPTFTTEGSQYKFLTRVIQKLAWQKKGDAKFMYIQKRVQLLRNLRSKLRIAKYLMNLMVTPDTRTIIFCGSIAQCNELCGENVFHSESSSTGLDLFQQGTTNYLGAVDALNEGVNLSDIDQELMVDVNSVDRVAIQRLNKPGRYKFF